VLVKGESKSLFFLLSIVFVSIRYIIVIVLYRLNSSLQFCLGQELWHYIASQGPLPHTSHEFWQMVWEQAVCVIAMVTPEQVKPAWHAPKCSFMCVFIHQMLCFALIYFSNVLNASIT